MRKVASISVLLLAGLGGFLTGWFAFEKPPLPDERDEVLLVLRPVDAGLQCDAAEHTKIAGEWSLPLAEHSYSLEKLGWPGLEGKIGPDPPVQVLRLPAPLAKLKVSTKDGTPVELQSLPSQKKLKTESGFYRLKPGHYEFLASASGHVPDRLSVELSSGQKKEMTAALKEIPKPVQVARPQPPVYAPSAPAWSPPPAAPPAAWQRPARPAVPQPRFTPVPARPQPPPPPSERPAPLFTPIP